MKILNGLVVCMDTVPVLSHAHIDSLHTHTMDNFTLSMLVIFGGIIFHMRMPWG